MQQQLDRKFEKFRGGPTQPPETRVHVTMDNRNVITLNATCYRLIGRPPAAYPHFSRVDDTIAIEPVQSDRLPEAFPFRPNQSARYLNAAPFARHFGIRLGSTYRFISPEVRNKVLYLKLSDAVIIKRAKKARKKETGPES